MIKATKAEREIVIDFIDEIKMLNNKKLIDTLEEIFGTKLHFTVKALEYYSDSYSVHFHVRFVSSFALMKLQLLFNTQVPFKIYKCNVHNDYLIIFKLKK
jgi:regulatory protein YycH of two-component signal transduction system YycFG